MSTAEARGVSNPRSELRSCDRVGCPLALGGHDPSLINVRFGMTESRDLAPSIICHYANVARCPRSAPSYRVLM